MTGKRRCRSGLPVMGWRTIPESQVYRPAAFNRITLQGYQPPTAVSDRRQLTCKDGFSAAMSIRGVKVIERKPRSRPCRGEGTV